jgi:hypothetical protein
LTVFGKPTTIPCLQIIYFITNLLFSLEENQ